eukprot:GILJ01005869.1.p1 GENE.GILJ01005869.1~~GILJ01005869.1.p1  ORF type:complete len:484 (+),score=50.62 GILJ01005869.1:154-1452(+)
MDQIGKWQLAILFTVWGLFLVLALTLGGTGPSRRTTEHPSLASHDLEGNKTSTTVMLDFPYQWNSYFILQISVIRKPAESLPKLSKQLVKMYVTWEGSPDATGERFRKFDEEHIQRHVSCPVNRQYSDYVTIFKMSSITYARYRLKFKWDDLNENIDWIHGVDFMLIQRNRDFAMYEIGWKYSCQAIIVLILAILWFQKWRIQLPLSHLSLEQQWVGILLICLFLYNNPLFVGELYASQLAFAVIGNMFRMLFVGVLLIFWLSVFDSIVREVNGGAARVPFVRFYVPKIIFVGLYWVLCVSVFSYIMGQEISDPTYDWREEFGGLTLFIVFTVIFIVLYLVWLIWLVLMSLNGIQHLRRRFRVLLVFHLVNLIATLVGLFIGRAIGLDIQAAEDFLFFHVLFNMYVGVLGFLYCPISDSHINFDKMLESELS